MKTLLRLIAFAICARCFGADAANDIILVQRNSGNTGPVQRNVAPVATGLIGTDGSKVPVPVTVGANLTLSGSPLTLTASGGGTGTVTSVSVTTANGVSGSVATATTTPAITLTLGAITPSSINVSGTVTTAAANVTTANAMGALSIDVTKGLNTKSIAADSVFTFSGTPAASNQWFSVLITADSTARVATIPSSFSVNRNASITTVTVPASGKVLLTWQYDGSVYNLYGDPVVTTGTGNYVLSAGPTLTGTIAAASLSLSSLTSGRVNYATTAGLLTDSAAFLFDGTSMLTLGVNTTTLGKVKLFGSTSGDATIQPAAVAGSSTVVTLPNASSTLPIFGQQITFSGPTAARTITLPDAAFTVARTDAANSFTGTQTFTGTTPAILLASGQTNTGNVTISGKTSGSLIIKTADATAQNVTLTVAAQTSGAGTLTISDLAGASDTVVTLAQTQTLTNKTLTTAVLGSSTATTQAAGDSSTKVATTAFVASALLQTEVTLTDGATVTQTMVANQPFQNAKVTLAGNRTLAFSSLAAGMSGNLRVIQDGTGSRTLTLPANSKVIAGGAGAVTLTTTASAVDILSWYSPDGTLIEWTIGKNFN